MPFTTQTLDLQNKELLFTFTDAAKDVKLYSEELVNIRDIDRTYEVVKNLGSFNLFGIRNQLGPGVEDSRLEHWAQTVTTENYVKEWRSSWQNEKVNPMNSAKDAIKEARNLEMASKDQLVYDMFNLGFGTTVTGPDGDGLFDGDHQYRSGGGTFSNLETASALSEATLETAIINAYAMQNDSGQPLDYRGGFILVVPPQLEFEALRILNSVQTPVSPNNAVNEVRRRIRVHVSNRLTDTNAWFIVPDEKAWNPLHKFYFLRDSFNTDIDKYGDRTFVMQFQAKAFWLVSGLVRGNAGA